MLHKCCYKMSVGNVCITEEDGNIIGLDIVDTVDFQNEETNLLKEARKQLEEYFSGKRKKFDLPIKLNGTEFQLKVWNALLEIPYGETRSYIDIARRIGNPKACRAVGGANNKNPIAIIVPCHRVIGKDGSLVGFGYGIETKKFLLKLEKII